MANTKIQSEQIADDVALAGSPTTTTQSASDNSTKVATTAYVTTAVANLVDSAPSSLNTLNELAAAMNDNASFFSTVLPLSGGTMTGNISHASDFTLDVGGDLNLDAAGGQLNFKDSGTTRVTFELDATPEVSFTGGNLAFNNLTQNADIAFKGFDDSSFITALNLDMSAAGIATFNSGINIGNRGSASDPTLQSAIDPDTGIYWGGGDILGFSSGGSETMRVSGGSVGIGATSINRKLEIAGNNNGGAKANYIRITDTDTTATAANQQGGIEFFANDSSGGAGIAASMEVLYAGSGGGGEITLNTNASSGGTLTEALRIDEQQRVLIGKTSTGLGNTGVEFESGQIKGTAVNQVVQYLNRTSSDGSILELRKDNTSVGSLFTNSGALMLKGASTSAPVQLQTHDGNEDIEVDPDGFIKFETAGSEAMRIDSSRNLLIGKDTTAFGTQGIRLEGSNGKIELTRNNNVAFAINRLTSDGDLAQFYKDSSIVGRIGTLSGYPTIGNSAGLLFNSGNPSISAFNADTNSNSDGLIDIGASNVRFRDLYLSGGAFIGGTGSANKLDDYEEGTWTAQLSGCDSVNATGIYLKVGSLVFVTVYSTAFTVANASGAAKITNLPFTNSNGYYGGVSVSHYNCFAAGAVEAFVGSNDNKITFLDNGTVQTTTFVNGYPRYYMIMATYIAA